MKTKLWQHLAEIANTKNNEYLVGARELCIIRAAAMQMQDAEEALADDERVIQEQRAQIAELEMFLRAAQDKCFDIYINLSKVLPLRPVADQPASKKRKEAKA